jgi:hypothetical protein
MARDDEMSDRLPGTPDDSGMWATIVWTALAFGALVVLMLLAKFPF